MALKDFNQPLQEKDPEVFTAIQQEIRRQSNGLELIASENFVSQAVLDALGTVLTNKYAEGYPKKRYYGGCEFVDVAESLAIKRAKKLFGADYVNVQPHSGSQANMAVYFAMLKPGDTILAMNLSHGGHLTHGHPVNFSGKFYNIVPYGVSKDDFCIDLNQVETLAKAHRPKLILVGTSAYSRKIDYAPFREIADATGALLMADIAHPAGLVATKLHPDPVPYCDFVTTTTHKTLRGPRGGMVMCRDEHKKAVRSMLFPGIQGGPLMHVIAAKAVAFAEALSDDFVAYSKQVIANAQTLAATLLEEGFDILSGGTDTHVVIMDLRHRQITGQDAESVLETVAITVNKNMVPFDERPPMVTSGIRIGTPALTTRGMQEAEMRQIGKMISRVLQNPNSDQVKQEVSSEVAELCRRFPIYADLLV